MDKWRLLFILAELTLYCMQTYDPKPDSCAKQNNTAYERVKESLHSVKVCRYDATEAERQLQGELFDHWDENTAIMKATKIPISDLAKYLDHLHEAYEGIDERTRKKMNGVLFAQEGWDYKLMEWKLVKGDDAVAWYGMIAFGRSPDMKFVDCMFVIYKLDFKIAPKVIKWTTHSQHTEEQPWGVKTIRAFQNFVRSKALKGFVEEGITEQINNVESLDEISDA